LDRFCANEDDYHQRVINHMAAFPDVLKFRDGLHAFVWGHEVDLHDAGRGGGRASDFEPWLHPLPTAVKLTDLNYNEFDTAYNMS
jgi:hypothetical protein